MKNLKRLFVFICLAALLCTCAFATDVSSPPPEPEAPTSEPLPSEQPPDEPIIEPSETEPPIEEPLDPTPIPEPNIQINIEAEPPHYFWETPFTDYTVTEGLLLLAFCFACLYIVFKIFK